MSSPKITLYTNHLCPWAHRAHIALKESGVEYEEVIIDLDKPREPWYLEVNHRGLVPSLTYNNETIIESGIVAQFIADAFPSHLSPPSAPAENALHRARIAVFVDSFTSKVLPHFNASVRAASEAERDAAAENLVAAVKKEVEPLLAASEGKSGGKGPFFGGSERLTLAEVQTGSFLLRILGFSKPEHNLVSTKLPTLLQEQTPRFKAWAEATVKQESVNFIFDEKIVADRTRAKWAPKSNA